MMSIFITWRHSSSALNKHYLRIPGRKTTEHRATRETRSKSKSRLVSDRIIAKYKEIETAKNINWEGNLTLSILISKLITSKNLNR